MKLVLKNLRFHNRNKAILVTQVVFMFDQNGWVSV